jgi:hypothetical protein
MWRKRTVWLLGITAMALGPIGCVVQDADDSAFRLSWDLHYEGEFGERVTCDEADTPTVTITAQHLQTKNIYNSNFPCSAMQAVTEVLPLGAYEVTVTLLDAKGRPVYSLIDGPREIRRHGLTPLETIPFRVQSWDVAWVVARVAANGSMRTSSCAEVGGVTVELITQLPNEKEERYAFDCKVGEGQTAAIRNGVYGWQMRLLDSAGKSLAETVVEPFRVMPEVRAILPSVVFQLP